VWTVLEPNLRRKRGPMNDKAILEAFIEIFKTGNGGSCSRCGQPIEGILENLTCISDGPRKTAHFYCYYPQGVPDRSLEMTRWAMPYLTTLSPERARFFHAEP
jgi:hypothetical protein